MRFIISTLLLLLICNNIFSQNTNSIQLPTSINVDGTDPDPSAILEIQSSDQGVLFPRMSMAERSGILNPSEGLLIYQTDNDPGFYYFQGSEWIHLVTEQKLFDPMMPNGTDDLTAIHTFINDTNPYVVPPNTNFIGTIRTESHQTFPITVNDYPIYGNTQAKLQLKAGDEITTTTSDTDVLMIHGYESPDNTEVLYQVLGTGQVYTVPVGKQLYISRMYTYPYSVDIYIDGVIVSNDILSKAPGYFLILDAGSTITSPDAGILLYINGFYRP